MAIDDERSGHVGQIILEQKFVVPIGTIPGRRPGIRDRTGSFQWSARLRTHGNLSVTMGR